MNNIVKNDNDFFTKYSSFSEPKMKSSLYKVIEDEYKKRLLEAALYSSNSTAFDENFFNFKSHIRTKKTSSKEESNFDSFNEFTLDFINILRNDIFESGYSSRSEEFVKSLLKKNNLATKQWLHKLFLDYLDEVKVVNGILHIISHLKYDDIYPEGQYMAMGVTSNRNIEIRESALRAFENWGSKDSLKILRTLSFSEQWLQEYLEQVISDLEEE